MTFSIGGIINMNNKNPEWCNGAEFPIHMMPKQIWICNQPDNRYVSRHHFKDLCDYGPFVRIDEVKERKKAAYKVGLQQGLDQARVITKLQHDAWEMGKEIGILQGSQSVGFRALDIDSKNPFTEKEE